jgi:hypothetical protein
VSRKNRRRAELVRAGYSASLLERLAAEGKISPARPRPLHPLAMVQHPERARSPQRIPLAQTRLVYTSVWVPDETHPLGGRNGVLVLHRRVNLRKDELPRWIKDRPLYEFTKETPHGHE